jgi:hypothetical protein
MRHHRCFGPKCERRVLPGQQVVWISPMTDDNGGIIGGIPFGWVHAEHADHLPQMLRVTYADDLDSVAVRRQLMRVWDEKGRPRNTDPEGRKRFDRACLIQIADVRQQAGKRAA